MKAIALFLAMLATGLDVKACLPDDGTDLTKYYLCEGGFCEREKKINR